MWAVVKLLFSLAKRLWPDQFSAVIWASLIGEKLVVWLYIQAIVLNNPLVEVCKLIAIVAVVVS